MKMKYYKVKYGLLYEGEYVIKVVRGHKAIESLNDSLETEDFDLNDFELSITKKRPVSGRNWRDWRYMEGK